MIALRLVSVMEIDYIERNHVTTVYIADIGADDRFHI